MRRLPIILALLLALPTTSFAYTLQQLRRAAGDDMHITYEHRSRRLVVLDQMAWNAEHHDWGGLQVYRSPAQGLTLHVPASWHKVERAFGTLVSFVSPLEAEDDRIRENINVIAEDFGTERPSLYEYTAGTIALLRSRDPGMTFLSSRSIALGNNPAFAVTYDEDTIIGHMRFEQVWTIVGSRMYLLTLTATPETFDRYAPIFDTMLQTIILS